MSRLPDRAGARDFLRHCAIGETPPSLDVVFLVKTKKPQTIRVSSPPADDRRKRRVIALLETAVQGIAARRFHPQPGMQCAWCQFRNECMGWPSSMEDGCYGCLLS